MMRAILRPTFRGLLHILAEVKIFGKENIPKNGAYLIAINHISNFEPPFVLAFWPTAPEAAGAVELWDRPASKILARMYGGIQVHRGEYDRALIDTLLKVLKSGRPLLLAPEGGRSHTKGMQRAYPGVAYLADHAKVPVVPVGVAGTSDDFLKQAFKGLKPVLEIHIGELYWLPPLSGSGAERRAARQANADLIMLNNRGPAALWISRCLCSRHLFNLNL